jgi:hypothetical protein
LIQEAFGATLTKLAALVPYLKDATYVEEQEWRLILVGTPNEKLTRATVYGEALYARVSLKTDRMGRMDLHDVVTGPLVRDLGFARTTLDRCGYGDVPITQSRVPHR